MKRAQAIFALICENEPDTPAFGLGFERRAMPEAEEGIIAMFVDPVGIIPLVCLDLGDGSFQRENLLPEYIEGAEKMARETGKRIELVRFGPNGREHVQWITS